jgi:Ran GTPase-activating protein (RanGAP) involved in mRNA processing and transport
VLTQALETLVIKCHLQKLLLIDMGLTPDHIELLCNILANSPLKELDISWNKLKVKPMAALAEVLSENRSLSYLNISHNHLSWIDKKQKISYQHDENDLEPVSQEKLDEYTYKLNKDMDLVDGKKKAHNEKIIGFL